MRCSYIPWVDIAPKRHPVDCFSAITCDRTMFTGSGCRRLDGLVVYREVVVLKPIHVT
jgi:hypothetical protein